MATTDETERTDVRDTLQEVTTITIDRNDKGDTLRIATVTDRYRGHDARKIRDKSEKTVVVRDTVFIEKKDSSFVSTTNGTNFTNAPAGSGRVATVLKWIFAILCAGIVLIIVIRVCLRR